MYKQYSELNLRLVECIDLASLIDVLAKDTAQIMSLATIKLWLKQQPAVAHNALVKEDASAILDSKLTKDDYYFGRLQQSEQMTLFNAELNGSVVLVKLTNGEDVLGILAFQSEDAEHFDPRMDTLLLDQFKQLVAKLIVKLSD